MEREKPDAILPTLAGQTTLNTAMELNRDGALARHGVKLIGANARAIAKGEDRQLFKEAMLLAAAVTDAFGFSSDFETFCCSHPGIRRLTVIEIKPAGNLSPFLRLLPKYELHSFPELECSE